MADIIIKIPDGVTVENALVELARVAATRLLAMEGLVNEAIADLDNLVIGIPDGHPLNAVAVKARACLDRMKQIVAGVEPVPVFDFEKMEALASEGLNKMNALLNRYAIVLGPTTSGLVTDANRCLQQIKDMRN